MGFVILDTETTGVDDRAQVVEVGIIDSSGQELYNQLIRPTVPIDPSASAVNGITEEMLRDQPSFAQEIAVAARPQPNLDRLHEELLNIVPYWKARNIKKLLYFGM